MNDYPTVDYIHQRTKPHTRIPRPLFHIGIGRNLFQLGNSECGMMNKLDGFIETTSTMDVEFTTTPTIAADDWRQAQNLIKGSTLNYARLKEVRVLNEGNAVRNVFVIPSTELLRQSEHDPQPKQFLKDRMLAFLRVATNGLTARALGGQDPHVLGFDAVMDMLESCYMLHELTHPEPQIQYQCSCKDFWQSYKCRHSLGLSILRNDVVIPPIYSITNIGSKRKRGRPRLVHGGEALIGGTRLPTTGT